MSAHILPLFSIFLSLYGVYCYPAGPPTSVCFSKIPMHRDKKTGEVIPPQTSPSPFKIIVNATSYKPGDVINIKIDTDNAETFKGLFLQVRAVKKSKDDKVRSVPIGSYRRVIENTKIIGCDVAVDTITHKDPYVKYLTEMNWVAPLLVKNDVIVRATILANFSTYWTNVKSDVIRLEDVGPLPVEGLKEPWLKEIITTVQRKDDQQAMEDLIKARFEKGFDGALDPNGNVMVHYVTDLLPFEDKTRFGRPNLPPGFDVDHSVEQEIKETKESLPDHVEDEEEITEAGDPETDTDQDKTTEENDVPNVEKEKTVEAANPEFEESVKLSYQSKAEAYYEVLIKAVLGGDKTVANALQKMVKE